MLVRKAYRFRIYPEATQGELFRRTVGCCRLIYNLCLDQKKLERERSEPRKLSQFDQIKELTALKAEFDFLREVPHHPLVQTVMDLHKAFSNFSEHRAGFPTFRKKGQNDSFRYPDPKQVKIENDRIFLPKAGWTKMVVHRPVLGKVKSVTVSLVASDLYASIQVEHEVSVVAVNRDVVICIDLGGAQPIVLSDGRSLKCRASRRRKGKN
jgi:putative transposase